VSIAKELIFYFKAWKEWKKLSNIVFFPCNCSQEKESV
jgi:hypothetical protein